MRAKLACEALKFLAASLPIALVDLIKLLLPSLTIMHVGASSSNSTTELAGASLGVLTFNVAGNMISTAPLVAMDTIAPQAYGAGHEAGVGLAALRAIITCCLFLLPASPLWVFARPLLVAFGQPAAVAQFGAEYMRLMLPGLPPFFLFELTRKVLYAQSSTDATRLRMLPLIAGVVGLVAHFIWLRLFDALGWRGAPLALNCSYVTLALTLAALIRAVAPHALTSVWPRALERRLLLRDRAAIKHFLSTSAAALLSLSEWLFWEFVCFRVGTLGELTLAAYGIAYSLEPVFFMLPIGIGTALANSVGNALGAGEPAQAKRVAAGGLLAGSFTVAAYCVGVFVLGDALARCYSQDEAVLAAAAELWPAFCGFMLVSGHFGVAIGLMRGLGMQRFNATCVVLVLWPVGVPLVAWAAHTAPRVWLMLSAAYILLVAALLAGAGCADWRKLSDIAIAASGGGGGGESAKSGGAGRVANGGDGEGAGKEMHAARGGGLAAADSCAAEQQANSSVGGTSATRAPLGTSSAGASEHGI